jgi:hypothetical protein
MVLVGRSALLRMTKIKDGKSKMQREEEEKSGKKTSRMVLVGRSAMLRLAAGLVVSSWKSSSVSRLLSISNLNTCHTWVIENRSISCVK